MKKALIFILLGLLLLGCKQNDAPTYVEGTTKGFSPKELYISSYNSIVTDTISVDSISHFKKEFKLKSADFFTIYDRDGNTFSLYLEPGKKNNITLNNKRNEVVVTGDLSIENKLYSELQKGNDSLTKKVQGEYAKLNEVAFLEKMKDFEVAQNRLINKISQKEKLNPDFVKLLQQDILYTSLGWKQYYPMISGNIEKTDEKSATALKAYYAKIDESIKEDSILLKLNSYREVMDRRVLIDLSQKMGKDESFDYVMEYLNEIKATIQSPTIRAEVSYDFLKMGLSMAKDKKAIMDMYKSFGAKGEKLQAIEKIYAKLKKIEPGNPAPDFSYADVDGKAYTLTDFKGKILYIDIWATWCGPCKGEIPHLKALEKSFEGKDIAFVSISLDSDKDIEKWKTFVKKNKLGGIQLHADGDFNSKIATEYQINAIPRFILIGKDGKIINSDAERPTDEKKIKQVLEKALI
ncbi:TlpA family protein disulfide reductase [Chryseobacterium nematophagum]|uniref:TlpA family protein disulfide reductase n=1 Tax=Chryseobacterium nematophagum TaxID=2305228 RepID=A0A3M7TE89_9FLAO|nr:TlpA disulfide reductase family protein [Chryseobacterium nematophagum]RNA60500.1 TlpA family protein disulfide reductase [Chryseobacterium nematophagum]